jgi:outer membrane protein assembly factor BamB
MVKPGMPQGEQRGKGVLPALLILVVGVLVSAVALTWWLGTMSGPVASRRVPLDGEAAGAPQTGTAAERPVRIGEHFARIAGVPSTLPGSWPAFRGELHDNVAPVSEKLADTWPAGGPRRLWSIELGEGYAGPAVRNGCVYVLDYDGDSEEDALRCFSLDDGREIWRRSYQVRIKRNHGISRTVPAVTDRHVVTIGPRCHVMCADAITGDLRWGMDLEKDWGVEVPMWYTGQCPLIEDGQAVIGVGGRALMVGVDCETGKVIWQTPNPR